LRSRRRWRRRDLVQRLCRDLDILAEVYRKFLVEAVDDTIKQVLFLYLAVCLGRLSHRTQADTYSNPM